jgi:phenylacetate-coenzyme A ligase PaaK-like adenylate-forming protein
VTGSALTATAPIGARPGGRERLLGRLGEQLARETWPRARLLAHQRARLRELLTHAVAHSPYYAQTLGRDAAERPLSGLPTLPKRTLMQQWARIVCDPRLTLAGVRAHAVGPDAGEPYLGEFHVYTSSGSTGLRGLVVFRQHDWEIAAASILRCSARIGVPPGARTVSIAGADTLHMSRKATAIVQAADPDAPNLSARTPLRETVAALNAYQPEVLYGYPSVAALLAREQLAGRLRIAPRWLAFGSELLTPAMRADIRRAWGSDPFEYYVSTEAPVIACSAAAQSRTLEVFEDLHVVEIVDEHNQPVPPGTPGAKVLVTNLGQRTLPLIRYELSDRVTRAPGATRGRPFAVLAAIDGRSADTLTFPPATATARSPCSPSRSPPRSPTCPRSANTRSSATRTDSSCASSSSPTHTPMPPTARTPPSRRRSNPPAREPPPSASSRSPRSPASPAPPPSSSS